MTNINLKWAVEAAPTGQYRSFFRRGWPTATWNGKAAAALFCEDEYVPANVRSGNHGEITIKFADYRAAGTGFVWKTLKRRASTLDEAKQIAKDFLIRNPDFLGEA